jgi:hypothetical protein
MSSEQNGLNRCLLLLTKPEMEIKNFDGCSLFAVKVAGVAGAAKYVRLEHSRLVWNKRISSWTAYATTVDRHSHNAGAILLGGN